MSHRRFGLGLKLLLVPPTLLLLYTLLGFFAVPAAIRWYLPKFSSETLQHPANLGKVAFNPFLLSLEARDFLLAEADGTTIAGFDRLFVDLEWTGLFKKMLLFDVFQLERPFVHVVLREDGGVNLAELAPPSKAPPPEESGPLRLVVRALSIHDGSLALSDRRQFIPAEVQIEGLSIALQDLSTLEDHNGTYSFSGNTGEGEAFQWEGDLSLKPLRSSGRLALCGLRVATLAEFLQNRLAVAPPAGRLEVSGRYQVAAGSRDLDLSLEDLRLNLCDFSVRQEWEEHDILQVNRLELDGGRLDLAARDLQVARLGLFGGGVNLRIDRDGVLNAARLVRPPDVGEEPPPKPTDAPAETGSAGGGTAQTEAPPQPPTPWKIGLDAIEVDALTFSLINQGGASPPNIQVGGLGIQTKTNLEIGPQGILARVEDFSTSLQGLKIHSPDIPGQAFPFDIGLDSLGVKLTTGVEARGGGTRVLLEDFSAACGVGRIISPALPGAVFPLEGRFGELTVDLGAVLEAGSEGAGVDLQHVSSRLKALEVTTGERPGGPLPVNLRLNDLALGFHLTAENRANQTRVSLDDIASTIEAVRLDSPKLGEILFAVERMAAEGGALKLADRSMTLNRFALQNGEVNVTRDREGMLNWMRLAPKRVDSPEKTPVDPGPSEPAPWNFLVRSFEVSGFRSSLSDLGRVPDRPLYKLQDINVKASELDGRSPMPVSLDFRVEEGGTASIGAVVHPSVPSVDAKVDIKDLVLTPIGPYLEPFITPSLKSAAVSTRGNLHYGPPDKGGEVTYEGNFNLDRLALVESGSTEPLVGWDALQLLQLKTTLKPNRLDIGEVRLVKPVGRLIIGEDRSINLARIRREVPGEPQPAAPRPASGAAEGASFPFRIGKLTVERGDVVFADFSLTPKFMVRINDLKGVVGGLSSSADSRTKIQLDGRVEPFGMAKVRGEINLFDPKRATNVDMTFRNLEMNKLTPYSGKFAGRRINSGKLSMDLKYQIQNSKMVGDNRIIVENLELGERVESPDAVGLPLDLAVALMTDGNGRIDIGLPVTGDLSDPQFSIWPLLGKALLNVVTRAVTAPFRALAGVLGDGVKPPEELSFDPGKSDLAPPEQEKLRQLGDALRKRPQLRVKIQGAYSVEEDRPWMQALAVRRSVAARMGMRLETEEDPGPLDFHDGKTQDALEELFEQRFGKDALKTVRRGVEDGSIRPRAAEGQGSEPAERKKQGVWSRVMRTVGLHKMLHHKESAREAATLGEELFTRLAEAESIGNDALVRLATRRAEAVRSELEAGGVAPERLIVGTPDELPEGTPPTVKLSLEAD